MNQLGWRSWLVVAALLLWLLTGIGLSWIFQAANAADTSWTFAGVPLAGVVLPIQAMTIIMPAERPADLPEGQYFARSRWGLLLYSVMGMIGCTFALVLLPIGVPLFAAAAQDAWASDDIIMAVVAGLCALFTALIVLPMIFILPWLMLRPAWGRRRWPFAVIGTHRLWLDGEEYRWREVTQVAIRQTRSGKLLLLDTTQGQQITVLFALAGPTKVLQDAIAARIRLGNPNG